MSSLYPTVALVGALLAPSPQKTLEPSPTPTIKTAPRMTPEQREIAELRALAQRAGRTPVMIGVRLPEDLETDLRSFLGDDYREAVSAAQTLLLDLVEAKDPEVKRSLTRFTTIPYVAARTDGAGIDELERLYEEGLVTTFRRVTRLSTAAAPALPSTLPDALAQIGLGFGTSTTGEVVRVVVVDTGIDDQAEHFGGRVVSGAYFASGPDGSEVLEEVGAEHDAAPGRPAEGQPGPSHGTLVASLLAGADEHQAGVAPGVELVSLRVSSYDANGAEYIWDSDVCRALQHVVDRVEEDPEIAVVNISLVGKLFTSIDGCAKTYPGFREVVQQLQTLDVAVVASAGNGGSWKGLSFPACVPEVLSVSATEVGGTVTIWSKSNSHAALDFWAPGVAIDVTSFFEDADPLTGTSFSAPFVAGAWALLRQAHPGHPWKTYHEALTEGGVWLKDKRNGAWARRLDVGKAMTKLAALDELAVQ